MARFKARSSTEVTWPDFAAQIHSVGDAAELLIEVAAVRSNDPIVVMDIVIKNCCFALKVTDITKHFFPAHTQLCRLCKKAYNILRFIYAIDIILVIIAAVEK